MTTQQKTPTTTQKDSGIAIAAMVLGALSLTGFGFVLGIPAIILAIIALKKNEGRGLSIAGLVTGIVGTILSFLFIIFIILTFIWAADHPEPTEPDMWVPERDTPAFESSRI